MSFHPVQTLTPETPPGALDGVVVGVEGDTEAVAYGTRLAERIGATPIRLSADEKVRYHAAAVLASNGLVALAGVAQDVLATAGIAPDVAQRLLRPLFAQTADNVGQADPAHVLTGPVVRGDCGTVSEHRKALEANIPRVRPLYDRLSEEMVRLAEQNGRLPPEAAAALRRLWCSKPDT